MAFASGPAPARPAPVPLDSIPAMTGRVFRRSLDPELPVAVEAHDCDDPRRGRPRVPRCRRWRDRRQRRSWAGVDRPGHGGAAGPPRLRARLRVHERAPRGVRGGDRAASARRRPRDLPGQRRLRGDGDGAEAGPRLPPRPRRGGALDRASRAGASYHGNTLGALDLSGRRPLRRPYEGWLGRFRHVSAAYPYRAGDPDAQALGDRRGARRGAGAGDRGGRSRDRRRLRRRADRRRDARGRGAAGRLLAGDRRGLPAPRRARSSPTR